jgi:hypothetical protein
LAYLNTTVNITRDVFIGPDGNYDYTYLRDAIAEALQDNFYTVLNQHGITTISTLDSDNVTDILILPSMDSNVININKLTELNNYTTLAQVTYTPYISYVKYSQYLDDNTNTGYYTLTNRYKAVATVLLNIIVDKNICGFSILSPSDLQLVDAENNVYSIRPNVVDGDYTSEVVANDPEETFDTVFPDIIKLQSSIIRDNNSYYELYYSDLNTPYVNNRVPCINGSIYYNGNTYNFVSLFNNLYTNLDTDTTDESIIGTVLLNPKLVCQGTINDETNTVNSTNEVTGFSSTVFDCPALNVPDYWELDNQLNVGADITIGDSEYIISDKNTLIQLTNIEIFGINRTVVYNGQPHIFNLVYPEEATAYFRIAGTNENWKEYPKNPNEITDYVDAQTYNFEFRVDLTMEDTEEIKSYYGTVVLNILPATQYGYLVRSYDSSYDGLPHTIYVFSDGVVTYSEDEINWTTTPPNYTDVGEYTVYYRIQKENYITVQDSAIVRISANNNTETLDFGIDTTSNIIVMRQQLYSNVGTDLYLYPTDNKVYLSTNVPYTVNTNDFTGSFPRYGTAPTTSVLGTFRLSPNDYFMFLECFLPWYSDDVEPVVNNIRFNNMLGDTVRFSVEYINGELTDSVQETDWKTIAADIQPSNAFYQYRITNIAQPAIDGKNIGCLWGDKSGAQPSVKRFVLQLPLSAQATGTNIKTIRIKCTTLMKSTTHSSWYTSNISSKYLGISVMSLQEYTAPGFITSVKERPSGATNTYDRIYIKFKSALTDNAFFSYNTGTNLQFSGVAELNYDTFTYNTTGTVYPGIDTETGRFDNSAVILWRNGSSASVNNDDMSRNWLAGTYFTVLKNQLSRIQFNSDAIKSDDNYTTNSTNTDKIYAYLACNTST